MYNNIGKNLKGIASIVGVIGMLICAIGVIVFFSEIGEGFEAAFYNALAFIISGAVILISSWPLYAFGDITENVDKMRRKICGDDELYDIGGGATYTKEYTQDKAISAPYVNRTATATGTNEWKCSQCGRVNPNYVGTCGCGNSKNR